MINASGPEVALFDWPGQQPLFYAGATPVFEVWFLDRESDLYFVMTTTPEAPALRGGIGFHPSLDNEGLRRLVDAWRAYKRGEPVRATGN